MLHFEKFEMKVESASLQTTNLANLKGARLSPDSSPGRPEHIKWSRGSIEFQAGFPRGETTRITMKPQTHEKRKDTCSTLRED